MYEVIDRARTRAEGARTRGEAPGLATPGPLRTIAIGDPQTSTTRWFGALHAAGALAPDGWLRPEIRLIAMGDYFDYHAPERLEAQVEGPRILSWLAAHSSTQVTLLLGNHDTARVMELIAIDDARFEAAHHAAVALGALMGEAKSAATTAWHAAYPELAVPGYAARDYNAFTVEQRRLVQRLLLQRRFALAAAARALDGQPLLLTHAGVATAQLAQLGLTTMREPAVIATALNTLLDDAVATVAADWAAERATALSLAPLHVPGADGKEGGGLLYHRPSDPERPGADPAWELAPNAPRRFDPRTLPRGLVQVVGHTGHLKAYAEMPRWRDPAMPVPSKHAHRGGLRTLAVTGTDTVSYRLGVHARPTLDDAVVWMIDPEMHYVQADGDVAFLELSPT